jgi:hypothetical protein
MRKSYICILQLIAFLFSPMAIASESLCKSDETIIFSCPVKNAKTKTVSVCALKSLTNGGYIQYRFGRKDKIELSIPSTTQASDVSIDGDSGGNRSGGSFIRFRNGVYSYVVLYTYILPSGPDSCNGMPCEQGGVLVEKSGKVISKVICQGIFDSEITNFPADYLDKFGIPRAKDYWPNDWP